MIVGTYAVGVHGHPRAIDGTPVSVIGLARLLENERASARPQDLADVAALERLQRLKR